MSKALKSSLLITVLSVFQRTTGLITFVILARLLDPKDLGLVTAALFFVYLVDIFSNSGIQQYICQKQNINNETIYSAWTLDIILKSITFFTICALSYPISVLKDNSAILLVSILLGASLFIRSFANPWLHNDRRNLEYKNIINIDIIKKSTAMVATIVSALILKNYWAIVIGDVISSVVFLMLSYSFNKKRPAFSTKEINSQLNFTKWLIPRGVLGYLRAEIDILFVSAKFGLADLGGYRTTKELTTMPATDLARPILEPQIAAVTKKLSEDDNSGARRILLNYLNITSIVSSTIFIFIFFNSESIVHLILGEKWLAYSSVLQTLSILLFVFSLNPVFSNALISYKCIKKLFYFDLISLILVAASIISINYTTLEGFSLIRAILAVLSTVALSLVVVLSCKTGLYKFYSAIFVPLFTSTFAYYIFHKSVPISEHVVINSFLYAITALFIHLIATYTLNTILFHEVKTLLLKVIGKSQRQ